MYALDVEAGNKPTNTWLLDNYANHHADTATALFFAPSNIAQLIRPISVQANLHSWLAHKNIGNTWE